MIQEGFASEAAAQEGTVQPGRPGLWGAGLGLLAVLCLPPVVVRLESAMAGQMVVQIPLLILAGYWLGNAADSTWSKLGAWIGNGTGICSAAFTLAFWMLPRSLDAAITSLTMDAAKYVSLVLLCGFPLGIVWSRLGFVARGFVRINLLSMIAFLGWVYLASPVRICNAYLLGQQRLTGRLLLSAGIAYILFHAIRIVIKSGKPRADNPHTHK
jgi:hypothetical protein